MASIPLASTSRTLFALASSAPSRLLRRQLVLQAGYAASRPISSIASTSTSINATTTTPRRRQQQLRQCYRQCRHSSSTGKGMGSRTLPEESHVNPSTGLGGSNTEQSFFSKTHTSAGGGGGKALAPLNKLDAAHVSKTSGTSEVNWIAKQLEMMERRDNIKNEAPIKVGSCLLSLYWCKVETFS